MSESENAGKYKREKIKRRRKRKDSVIRTVKANKTETHSDQRKLADWIFAKEVAYGGRATILRRARNECRAIIYKKKSS